MNSGLSPETPCPACGSSMNLRALQCDCGVTVEGPIEINEFASLNDEQLQFLRLFVMLEGRIRDIEKALGVSYPTVKGKIRDLKLVLHLEGESDLRAEGDVNDASDNAAASPIDESVDPVTDVLDQLEKGEISAADAIGKLK